MSTRPTRASFASLPDRGDLVAYDKTRQPTRTGAYTWHAVELSEEHALRAVAGGELVVTGPNGHPIRLKYERHVEHPDGNWTWIGRVPGAKPGAEAILTFGEKAVFGSIPYGDEEPLRLTMAAGRAWLMETDRAAIARMDNAATRPREPDFLLPPKNRDAPLSSGTTLFSASQTAAATTATATTTVDVLLGYTSGFATRLGGQSQAVTRLTYLVDVTNQAYVNSQIDAQVRLVRTMQVDYSDATSNQSALYALTGVECTTQANGSLSCTYVGTVASLQPLHTAREESGADLVSLVRNFNDPENGGCGIAWLIGGGQSNIDAGDADSGMSVVSDSNGSGPGSFADGGYVCRDETLAHELGHNMGSAHDRDTADGDDNVLQTNEYGRYPYSFGYKTGSGAGNFYTVMAYGDSGQVKVRVFSNPDITYCGGFACGVANQADNARSLRQTIPVIASFRSSAGPVIPPVPFSAVRDANADGKSDMFWHNPGSGEVHYYLMNGTDITGGRGAYYMTLGYRVRAAGDYNGDGRVDLLWSNGTDVRMSLATASGTFNPAATLLSYPVGWNLLRAGDVNGDGKADMLWHNPGSGEVHYYLMNGTDIIGGRGAYYMTLGYTVRAVGDYNGDGRADLLWSNGADVRMSLATASGTFNPAVTLLAYPVGWNLLAAGDANGDGKADIFWHNPGSGEVHYYLMNGTDIIGGRGAYYMALGYTVRAVGDYNGDGRADLLWSNGADVRMSLATGSGTFNPAVTLLAYPAGWQLLNDDVFELQAFGDTSSDGKSDILWHNPGSGEVHYYLMNGTDIMGGRGAYYMTLGYTVRAVGDYNGDGRADLLWSNGADVRMSLATGSGTFNPAVTLLAYPSGWNLMRAGDVNGDGKSDMLWHNPGSGEVHYYLMNGTDIIGGRGAYYMTPGYTVRAVGDYNGDGRVDLLWSNGANVRMSLATASGTFNPAVTLLAYPSGWNLQRTGDVNGDGKSDMLWHNPGSGEVHYYLMNGTDIIGGRGAYYMALGYTVRAVGDYNGDGRADLLWSNGADVRMSLATGSGTFNPAVTLLAYPSGWNIVN